MNATPITPADILQDHVNGSDSDSNLEDDDAPEYYQPISAVDDEEDSERDNESDGEDRRENENDDAEFQSERLSNGFYCASQEENGMSSLSLHNDLERNKSSSEEDEDEEEEARVGITPDSAITRAFREDENRRNAPLTPENATRVMEAMRGISFSGLAPDWADRVPEDRWLDKLRRSRQPPQD